MQIFCKWQTAIVISYISYICDILHISYEHCSITLRVKNYSKNKSPTFTQCLKLDGLPNRHLPGPVKNHIAISFPEVSYRYASRG